MDGLSKKVKEYGKGWKTPQIFLVIADPERLQQTAGSFIADLGESECPGIFLTLNLPYKTAKKRLQDEKISTDNVFFVDCITKTLSDKTSVNPDVVYAHDLSDLTGLGIVVTQFLQSIPGQKFICIDNVKLMSLFNKTEAIATFIRSLSQKANVHGSSLVCLYGGKGAEEELLDKIAPFFTQVIDFQEA